MRLSHVQSTLVFTNATLFPLVLLSSLCLNTNKKNYFTISCKYSIFKNFYLVSTLSHHNVVKPDVLAFFY